MGGQESALEKKQEREGEGGEREARGVLEGERVELARPQGYESGCTHIRTYIHRHVRMRAWA